MLKSKHFWRVWLPPHVFAALGLVFAHDWRTFLSFFVFYTLVSGLGVAVGFHRYFSHKSFQTSSFWQHAMLFWGSQACHGNPFFWVALHRGLHHRFSDTDKDPHSPIHGRWYAYQGYAFDMERWNVPIRAGADFLRNKSWMWSVNHYHKVLWTTWGVVAAGSALLHAPWLFVGFAYAQVWAIHQEAAVNLLGHTPGFGAYRNYATDDKSVNRNWLGVITWGQSLHNNHHYAAGGASFAHTSKEFDPCVLWINAIQTP